MALWLWRRNHPTQQIERAETWHFAVYGLLTTVLVVAADAVLTQMVLLRDFPDITFFVQHVLVGFVFICAWTPMRCRQSGMDCRLFDAGARLDRLQHVSRPARAAASSSNLFGI
ncbi:hypothetical protein [Sinorhizobium psoraleae]|uniref:hypothetical protein n=1 Tax=Sinorhizobium psoraleae TaxID=520838 RepID=UPI0015685F49|nr:hypothetical protein [Sinorhizobium psoraleae]